MNLEVEFHKLSGDAMDTSAGKIRLDDRGVSIEPQESTMLQTVLASPVTNPVDGKEMIFEDNPLLFLNLLQYQYHSPYLRAMAPTGDGIEQEQEGEEEAMASNKDNAPKNAEPIPSLKEFHKGKSLPYAQIKSGWTGVIRDRLGRNQCYQEGTHVSCSQEQVQQHMEQARNRQGGEGGGPVRVSGDTGGAGPQFNRLCDQLLDEELHRHRDRVRHARFRERRRWWRTLHKNIRKGVAIAGVGLIIGAGAFAAYKRNLAEKQKGEGDGSSHESGDRPQRSQQVALLRDIDPNGRRGVRDDFGHVPDEKAHDTWMGLKDDQIMHQEVDNAESLKKAVNHVWDHADWMDATPSANERVEDFAARYNPALAKLKDRIDIKDIDNPAVRQHLYELGQLPENVLEEIAPKVKIYVGAATVTGLDANENKRGVKPQGWPEGLNTYWDDAAGMYDAKKKQVAVGIGGHHGSASLAVHQMGHALGNLLGYDNSLDLEEHHKRLYGWTEVIEEGGTRREIFHHQLDPYLRGKYPGDKRGRKELLAEGLAIYMKRGKDAAIHQFDKEFVGWLESNVLKKRPPRTRHSTIPGAPRPGNN